MALKRKSISLCCLVAVVAILLAAFMLPAAPGALAQALNSNPPAAPVRLVFIHHSVGEAWLTNNYGNLLRGLNTNKYFVSDTKYGWGLPDDGATIGDHTDIGHWYNWFLGPRRNLYLAQLYPNTHLTSGIGSNSISQPGGDNTVVMFKSCYPNSGSINSGNPDDPPRVSSSTNPNPIWGQSAGDSGYTVSNIKGLYRDLLAYFATRQDKLFILITSPPTTPGDTSAPGSQNRARGIHTWLAYHWLDDYPYDNVAVFDFYNVLTSNGGSVNTNDLGAVGGNHHRYQAGQVQHVVGLNNNYAAYASGDSHPTPAGGQKATGEYLPLLNIAYHAWQKDGGRPWYMGRSPRIPGSQQAAQLLLLD